MSITAILTSKTLANLLTALMELYSASLTGCLAVSLWIIYLDSGTYQMEKLIQAGTTSSTKFYRNRGDSGEVSLNRPSNVTSPFGLFCCEVPDATGTNQTLCVNIGMFHNVSVG